MNRENKGTFPLLFAAFLALSLAGWAQDKATIVGTVTDTTGAVIPNAKITVSNPDKGFTRELVGGYPKGYFRYTDFEPYFQDDWKVTRRLTLNLGIRYYLFQPHREVSNPPKAVTFLPRLYNPAAQAQLDAAGNIVPGSGFNYTTFGSGLVACGAEGIARSCTAPLRGNVAPRFGFAFDPTGSGKTSIRGGYGIFYDIGSGGDANAERIQGNPPIALAPSGFNIVGYQNIQPGALGTIGISTIPERMKWPAVQQFSFSVQREFPGNNLLSVGYIGTLGRHLSRSRNLNQVPIGVTTMNVPVLAGTMGCDAAGNCDVQSILIRNLRPTIFFVPFRGYAAITMVEHTAISSYNALQVDFRLTFGAGLTLQAAYTWAHNLDDASSSGFQCVDPSNFKRCYGTSDLNRTHSLVMNYMFALPFFKNATRPVLKNVLGGWRLSGITSFFTGQPITPGCGLNQFRSGIGGGVVCNSLGRLEVKKGTVNDPQFGPTPTWFDPGAFGQPTLDQLLANLQPGMFGYMGRNVLRGPGRNNWDVALLKEFSVPWLGPEHSTVQFRLETFNTFNHPQWQGVRASCAGNTPPGEPCSGPNNISNGQIVSAWPARVMQLALKFMF